MGARDVIARALAISLVIAVAALAIWGVISLLDGHQITGTGAEWVLTLFGLIIGGSLVTVWGWKPGTTRQVEKSQDELPGS